MCYDLFNVFNEHCLYGGGIKYNSEAEWRVLEEPLQVEGREYLTVDRVPRSNFSKVGHFGSKTRTFRLKEL